MKTTEKYQQIDWENDGRKLSAVLYNNKLWLSQKTISLLLHIGTNTVCFHISDMEQSGLLPNLSEGFIISRLEGGRIITRKIKHYPVEVAQSISVLSKNPDLIKPAIELAKTNNVIIGEIFVTSRKEFQFWEFLSGVLDGIVTVKRQHKVGNYLLDFYIPEISTAIEYDEKYHSVSTYSEKDRLRQSQLEIDYGIHFVRVAQGKEIIGINAILKIITDPE